MACTSSVGPDQHHLVATSTTLQYEWYSQWELCIGVSAIKAVIKRRASTAFQAQFAIQVAPVRTDKPNTPVTLGSLTQNDGEDCSTTLDISSHTSGNFWIRTGVAYSATSATVGQSDVTFQASLVRCGSSLGALTKTLSTYTTTAGYEPITGWLSALDVETIKAAIVISGLVGSFGCRLAFRTATTSTESPGAWSTTFATQYTANGEYPLADTAVTGLSGVMFVQFGIQFYNTPSGTALGQATVSVALAGKR